MHCTTCEGTSYAPKTPNPPPQQLASWASWPQPHPGQSIIQFHNFFRLLPPLLCFPPPPDCEGSFLGPAIATTVSSLDCAGRSGAKPLFPHVRSKMEVRLPGKQVAETQQPTSSWGEFCRRKGRRGGEETSSPARQTKPTPCALPRPQTYHLEAGQGSQSPATGLTLSKWSLLFVGYEILPEY